jgi:nitrite reductase/ring-hydroxylating ferredoxin subunit
MPEFATVARADELAPGKMKLVQVGREEVVLANVDGTFYAFGNECTHAGAPLAEGDLSRDVVRCPRHGTEFDVKTGKPLRGPGKEPLPTYEVRVENGEVRVAATQ